MVKMGKMESDRKLISRFLKGDEEAFGMLMSRYEKPLYFFICRMVGNHEDAADICQRTFVQVFLKVRGFLARSSFKTWLYLIASNQSLNLIRSRGRTPTDELFDEHIMEADVKDEKSGADEVLLRRLIVGLPEKQRLTLVLRIYQEMSFKEISSVVGITENSAKVNYHHAITSLRKRMRDYDGLHKG